MAINYPQRYDDDFLNTIKTVIDHVNVHGKTIQDLVAEGQLTEEQYAELIKIVNANISKGDVSVHDIDKNKGKFDQTWMADELLQQMAGNTPINAVPADGSLTTEKFADNSVTIEKTAFTEEQKNIASGSYLEWGLVDYNGALHLQKERSGFHTRGKLIEVAPNTEYTASRQGDGNRFAIAGFAEHPSFSIEYLYTKPDEIIIDDPTKEFYTFTTGENTNYIYFYVDQRGREPEIQVEYGDELTPYTFPYVIGKKYVEPVIKKTIEENLDTVTIIEDIEKGYPKRPDAISVIWIGPNEPMEVEPYDEWRKTEGFTYFTDFYQYRNGEIPSDWVMPWNAAETLKVENGLLLFELASSKYFSTTLSEVDTDSNRMDSEIYLKSYSSVFGTTGSYLCSLHRGRGTIGTEQGYTIGLRLEANGTNLSIRRHQNSSSQVVLNKLVDIDPTVLYHQVSRIDGDRIRAKIWQDGQPEPKEWLMDVVDSNPLTETGSVGVHAFITNTYYVYDFGVGTGGMRAPRRRLIR